MGFTFAGIHSSEFGIKVLNIQRSLSPGISSNTVKIPGRAGVYDMGVEVDELPIPIEVLFQEASLRDMREKVRRVAAWLRNQDQLGELIFDDEPDKYYQVRLIDKTELEEIARSGRGTITFTAPDPLAYAVEDDVFTTNKSQLTFQRKGTALSRPIVEITGVSSGVQSGFQLQLNDQVLTYTGTLNTGETLVIDSYYQTAYIKRVDGSKQSALNGLDRLDFPSTLPSVDNVCKVIPIGITTFQQLTIRCHSCWY